MYYVETGSWKVMKNNILFGQKTLIVWQQDHKDVDVQPILLLDWVVEKRTLFLKNQFVQGDLQPVMGLWPV